LAWEGGLDGGGFARNNYDNCLCRSKHSAGDIFSFLCRELD